MSRVAEETGIGRATLYKYFPDVESILLAWHDRQVAAHMQLLAHAGGRANDAGERLQDVLATYADLRHNAGVHRDTEIAALLHGSERAARAEQELHDMVRELIAHAAAGG